MSLMSSWARRFKDWAPRDHGGKTPEEHMKQMYSIGQPSSKFLYLNPVISGISAVLIWGFVIWAMARQEKAQEETAEWQKWVTDVWNWLYMISQNVWIVALIYLMVKYWNLKLGKDTDQPEFSDATYFAMLFSCGVATGLWYYTAEAMWHYEGYNKPRWRDTQMFNDNTRAEHAMMVTFFHWGVHGWIPYTTVGALLAILSYRRGFPMSMRFTLYPLCGEMVYGVLGDLVEVLSILCTIFGVCTSLGLGAMQINKALVRLDRATWRGEDFKGCNTGQTVCGGNLGVDISTTWQIWIIIGVTLLATASVVAGLKAGIARLSQIAFGLSLFVLIAILFMDNTWYILNALTSSFGYYLWYLPKISFHTDAWEELGPAYEGNGGAPDGRGGLKGWMNGWTIFYWGWWISWGPFVGTFLARISKGRRLGHFIVATLLLPSLWSFIFLGVFGAAQIRISNEAKSAGLNMSDRAHTYGHLADKSKIGYSVPYNPKNVSAGSWFRPVDDGTTRLYNLATEDVLFEHLSSYGGQGFSGFMTVMVLICIVLYFITSSDSASFVVDIMAANGVEEPPLAQKVFWAFTEGAAACALLASAGDDNPTAAIKAVKALPIVLGLPFTFLLFWMCQGLVIVCKEETGDLDLNRKHFSTFLFNIEPSSYIAIVVPFVGSGKAAAKTWGGSPILYMAGFAIIWASMITFLFLGFADKQFLYLGAAAYFMYGVALAGLRVAVRVKLGISGDMVSDAMACCFAYPWAIGQLEAEDFTNIPVKKAIEHDVTL